ncbi:MAG: phospholipase D-like domain-containing protein [Planctomycetota bacterium]|jgi:phosphatidylserine/phosphatidylglycerophosphate/cardiolipin synthase-like enzyme|nr:phospholipase D-like domain-containing protein [Planctomycetota bacterium]MDP6941376.1 phospholipase D-like domain-containing protein [Planctomycetota bacterium]
MTDTFRAPYPFVSSEGAELYSDPVSTWEQLLADIASAREELLVENFILRPGLACDAIVDSMARAATNGADVKLMVDAFGSSTLDTSTQDRLHSAGIELQIYNPYKLRDFFGRRAAALPRTHRRLIFIDGHTAWVGGMAFDDQWWPDSEHPTARDSMLRLKGDVVSNLRDCFDRLWKGVGSGPRLRQTPSPDEEQLRALPQYAYRRPNYRRALHYNLHAAKSRVWIAVPYFIPGPRLLADLRIVALRGIDLRFLFPGQITDHPTVRLAARRYYGRLLRAGARIWEYQPAFMHSKLSIFDHNRLLVGSSNLDRWSLFINNELTVEACSARLVSEATKQLTEDFKQSKEVTLLDWKARPWRHRAMERLFGRFDKLF